MKAKELIDRIENDRDEHIKFLQDFVQAPSPNPPGDTRAVADVIIKYLQGKAIEPELIAPRPELPNIVVPAYVFGVSPETMAARDESVSIEEFLAVVKAHVLAAWEYLGGSM